MAISRIEGRLHIVPLEVRVREILEQTGAFLKGHFKLASGRHADQYVDKGAVFTDPELTEEVAIHMARPFQARGIEVVAGPATGGIIPSHEVGKQLARMEYRNIPTVFAEKKVNGEEGFEFNRGYARFIPDKNVLIVEDILTTGKSVLQMVDAVRKAGGNPIGIAAIVNRGEVKPEAVGNVPIYALLNIPKAQMPSWASDECPKCESGEELNTNVGHAKKLL